MLYKWKGYKRPQIEMEPPKWEGGRILSPRKVIKFGPLLNTAIDGKKVRFDADAGYLDTDEKNVREFIESLPDFKRGIIQKISFRKEAVFVESPVEEVSESPVPADSKKAVAEKRKPVNSVKDL